MKKPEGSRVVEIQVRCASCRFPSYQPIVLSTVYKVILSSYIVRGGAGLTAIDEKKLSHQVGNITVDRVIANYFKAKSPIMTGVEGRITFMNDNDDKLCVNGVNTFGLRFPLLIGAITPSVVRAIFNWVSKVIRDCLAFALVCSVIGPEITIVITIIIIIIITTTTTTTTIVFIQEAHATLYLTPIMT